MSDVALKTAEVGRIKDLLFGEERRLLKEVQQLVSRHDERIGTDDRLQQSVSHIIALALRDAQINQHEQLAAAISPLVMAGVKREILNSRHDLVDAMHPMMGHMMSTYVTNGLRDFLHQTDRRLENGLSPRRWRLRLKSAISGVPVHELILRERKLVKVEDILLLRRGSGALIDRWQAEPDSEPAKGGRNPALLSSMLSAITEFARDAFSDGKSELRALDIGSARILLRASPAYLVGIKCVGKMSAAAEKKIDRAVLRAFEDYSDALSSDARDGSAMRRVLPALAERLSEALAPEMADDAMRTGRLRYVTILATLLALMGFAATGRHIAMSFEASAKQREIEAVISYAEEFKGLPIAVRQDSSGRGFLVSGVAPSQDAAIALSSAIQEVAGPVPVTINLVTGLVTSTAGLVGETLNVVTGLVDGTLRTAVNTLDKTVSTAVNTVDKTVSTVVNLADKATQATVKTVDGVLQTTANVVTQTASAVETLTKRLGSLEQSLAVAEPGGKVLRLPKPIAELPQKLADAEERIKQGADERSLADLTGRLQALKQNLKSSALSSPNDPESARLEQAVAVLQNDIGALRSRSKSNGPASGAGVAPEDMNALLVKVASVEREAVVAPFKRQVQTLSDSLRDLKARLSADPEFAGDKGERQSRKARKDEGGGALKGDFDLAGELQRSLTPAAIDAEPYSAEASVRDLAARVKGTAVGPKMNGAPMRASLPDASADNPGGANPVVSVVQGTQGAVTGVTTTTVGVVEGITSTTSGVVTGVTTTTGGVVTGVSTATQSIVGGLSKTTSTLIKSLGGRK